MANKVSLKPTKPWTYVRHHRDAQVTAEAVMEVQIPGSQGIKQPCEIRLTDDDIRSLLRLPEVMRLADEVRNEKLQGGGGTT